VDKLGGLSVIIPINKYICIFEKEKIILVALL
jgi:hypothetical protein